MSEPKTMAREAREILSGVWHYRIHDERIDHGSDALLLAQGGRVVLVDPLPLEPAFLRRLGSIDTILLGSPSHQRAAWRYRRESGAKVLAPAGAEGLEETPDGWFRGGDALPGGLRAVAAPGPSPVHCAFHLERNPSLLYVADLLMNEPDRGLVFLPDKYMDDARAARDSARGLLDLTFDALAFGHGAPLTREAAEALHSLIASEKPSAGPGASKSARLPRRSRSARARAARSRPMRTRRAKAKTGAKAKTKRSAASRSRARRAGGRKSSSRRQGTSRRRARGGRRR